MKFISRAYNLLVLIGRYIFIQGSKWELFCLEDFVCKEEEKRNGGREAKYKIPVFGILER